MLERKLPSTGYQTGKKVTLNWVSNSQSPGHESYTLTTEHPRWEKSSGESQSRSDYTYVQSDHNSLPNNKILNLSKFKAFADDNIILTKKLKFVLGRVENIVGKGKNAGYQHFLLFPQCFQKLSFPEV